jgi:hypothetical protein
MENDPSFRAQQKRKTLKAKLLENLSDNNLKKIWTKL